MTGLMQRIFRRRAAGSPDRGTSGPLRRLRSGLFRRRAGAKRLPWGKQAAAAPGAPEMRQQTQETHVIVQQDAPPTQTSFRDRGKLRRRLRFLRRARELAFRDIGGLMFDMRRFGRERPDLVESKIGALAAVDHELRALERVLDDRRPLHELREPGITSCARCGALHSSEANFCPHCGLQVGGPRAMGEIGGAIAAPPQAPPAPIQQAIPAAVAGQAPQAPEPPAPAPAKHRPAPATTSPPTEARLPPHAPDDGS